MTKVIRVFCLPKELTSWLNDIFKHHKVDASIFMMDEVAVTLNSLTESHVTGASRIFIHPKIAKEKSLLWEDVQSRSSGWIDILPGRVIEVSGKKIITPTTIQSEKSETKENLSFIIDWLKKHLKTDIKMGVSGHNTTTGGKSTYKAIGYTVGAWRELVAGAEWKSEKASKSIFSPLDGEGFLE